MFFSIVPGLRAARKIGLAEERQKEGDTRGVMRACSEALGILENQRVDLERPWCRSAASQALWGYCRAAIELGLASDVADVLARWRKHYLLWINSPISPQEADYLKWIEQLSRRSHTT